MTWPLAWGWQSTKGRGKRRKRFKKKVNRLLPGRRVDGGNTGGCQASGDRNWTVLLSLPLGAMLSKCFGSQMLIWRCVYVFLTELTVGYEQGLLQNKMKLWCPCVNIVNSFIMVTAQRENTGRTFWAWNPLWLLGLHTVESVRDLIMNLELRGDVWTGSMRLGGIIKLTIPEEIV